MGFFEDNTGCLGAFRAGDRQVLARVYCYYERSMQRYIRALVRRSASAELCQPSVIVDLLQEVFARAFSPGARAAYDGRREYEPYLARIARNCFIDLVRTHAREVLESAHDSPFDLDVAPAHLELGEPRVRAIVVDYLAQLPRRLQSIYEERFVRGRSQEEASAALGLSRRQLRTGEERLREDLRKALRRAGVFQHSVSNPR